MRQLKLKRGERRESQEDKVKARDCQLFGDGLAGQRDGETTERETGVAGCTEDYVAHD